MADLAASDALVLLPRVAGTFSVIGPPGDWPDALRRWGLADAQEGADLCVVTEVPRDGAAPDAAVLVAFGRGGRRFVHARGGGGIASYRVRRLRDDVTAVIRIGASAAAGAIVRDRLGPPTWAQAARDLVHRIAGRAGRTVHVAGRTGPTPAAVAAAAVGSGPMSVGLFSADPRRRAALFVGDGSAVVKVARSPGEESRGAREQRVLGELEAAGLGRLAPRALGHGVVGGVAWSAESTVAGRPLDVVLDRASAAETRALLAPVAGWLGQIGAATRIAPAWSATGDVDDPLPLRGDAVALAPLLDDLDRVPGVLVHGDLASGVNLLVDDGAIAVIDWETAHTSLPLLDLLPLLCQSLARAQHLGTADAEGAYILALCRGERPDSAWLFDRVHEYLRQVDLPIDAAGRLAALSWGYQRSMRAVHDELVRARGLMPLRWTSPADTVSPAWMGDPRLGPAWRALTEHAQAS